jgi:Tfp pilus assembly protein PilV
MLVLISGVFAMAQLFLVAAATNAAARQTTVAATLAAQKVEQILSSAVAAADESVEHLDGSGRILGGGSLLSDAVYTRALVDRSRHGNSDIACASDVVIVPANCAGCWEGQMLTITRRTQP